MSAAARVRERFWTAANQLTLARVFVLPVLWALALLDRPVLLGIGVGVAGSTDVLDGWLARRSGRSSRIGSRLDTVADLALQSSVLVWLLMLRPFFFREQWPVLAVWAGAWVAVLAFGWVRFRRLGDLHLYSSKAQAFLSYVLVIWLLVLNHYSRWFFYLVMLVSAVAAVESLYVYATRDRVDERIGTVLRSRSGGARARGPG